MFVAMECKSSEHSTCHTIPCDCPCHTRKMNLDRWKN